MDRIGSHVEKQKPSARDIKTFFNGDQQDFAFNTCFIIIVTTLQACKLSKIAFNIQTKTSKVA